MSGWDDVSPDVEAILGGGEARKEARRLSPAQRKEAARQAARVRLTMDVPDWLKAEVLRVAEVEQTSASSLGARLLAYGLLAMRQGEVRLRKVPSESPRFEFLIDVSEDDAGL